MQVNYQNQLHHNQSLIHFMATPSNAMSMYLPASDLWADWKLYPYELSWVGIFFFHWPVMNKACFTTRPASVYTCDQTAVLIATKGILPGFLHHYRLYS